MASTWIFFPALSSINFCAMRSILALNAPASPGSDVTTTSCTLFSSRTASSGCETSSFAEAAAATLASMRSRLVPYGRAAIARSCARRSLAAETIFMALVICCMFLTLRMRRRMSIRLGMQLGFRRGGLGGRETLLELLDQRFNLLFDIRRQFLFLADRL